MLSDYHRHQPDTALIETLKRASRRPFPTRAFAGSAAARSPRERREDGARTIAATNGKGLSPAESHDYAVVMLDSIIVAVGMLKNEDNIGRVQAMLGILERESAASTNWFSGAVRDEGRHNRKEAARYAALKARVERLGYRLLQDEWVEKDRTFGREAPACTSWTRKPTRSCSCTRAALATRILSEIEAWCAAHEVEPTPAPGITSEARHERRRHWLPLVASAGVECSIGREPTWTLINDSTRILLLVKGSIPDLIRAGVVSAEWLAPCAKGKVRVDRDGDRPFMHTRRGDKLELRMVKTVIRAVALLTCIRKRAPRACSPAQRRG